VADDLPEFQAFALEYGCANEPCVAAPQFHHPKHQPTFAPWARPTKALPGKPGKAQRCSDWYGFGLCLHCHDQLHDKRGPFADMSREELRAWQDKATAKMHARWAMRHPDRLPNVVVPRTRQSKLATRGSKAGGGWTVPLVIDLLKKQARISRGEVAAALDDIAHLIERGKVH
jgi:hypothetical protein